MFFVAEEFLRHVLVFLATYTHDFGVAIVFLTIIIRVALLPLSIRIAKGQVLQMTIAPKLQKLKRNWKGSNLDLVRAQQELLKSHGVRPVSNGLMMLAQSPVFFVLYRLVQHLNQPALSVLVPWIPCIAQADPFHVLPIICAIVVAAGAFLTYTHVHMGHPLLISASVMFLVTMVILWAAPAAVAIYYTTSSTWGALERVVLGKVMRNRVLNPAS